MKVRWIFLMLTIGLVCQAAVAGVARKANTSAGWQTYHSPDYGFAIAYPTSMTFSPGHPMGPPQLSMFPICDDTTVACFQYNGNAFKNTTTQAAGVSVNVLRDLKTEQDCNKIDTGSGPPVRTVVLHGTLFHYGDTGEGGLGSSRDMTEYRTLYEHVCFEVAVVIAGSDIAPQEWKEEGLHPVNRRAWWRISHDMDQMLHSFKFVGPVKDGAKWSVYSDWGCGGAFEYPSSSAIREMVEYANANYGTKEITCEQAFTYKGRKYIVAAKVNLRGVGGADAWLSSSGYPGLEDMKTVAKGDDFVEYRDQTYAYLDFRDELFVFTVTGAGQQPIPSEGDAVFAHLLGSFRAR